MQLGVELKCCEVNKDICSVCGEKPRGDYWHRQNEEFLCRSCMINERKQPTKYSKQALQAFRVNILISYQFKVEKKID